MISDKLKNIEKYDMISEKVSNFLKGLTPDSHVGHYYIDESAYANIDVYTTKDINLCKFEAHKKYVDIQMLLDGTERLDHIFVDNLIIGEEYDDIKDVMFFKEPVEDFDTVFMTPFKFVMLYPYDAHKPQIACKTCSKVKKVVVKIKVDE